MRTAVRTETLLALVATEAILADAGRVARPHCTLLCALDVTQLNATRGLILPYLVEDIRSILTRDLDLRLIHAEVSSEDRGCDIRLPREDAHRDRPAQPGRGERSCKACR